MTRSTTLIPVSPIGFIGEIPSVHVIENRLQMFLRTLRALKQDNRTNQMSQTLPWFRTPLVPKNLTADILVWISNLPHLI
ncbi:hypothetical protein [Halocynthiibacter styelae]|uniref:Uncharacterized protein n=1 Tax=Halocynthiibacter styelae TaxID=2761955 RepID=A0A8J7IYG6_9RHOB|nr:hypothetical protein [Paenihalocynthiibacter styelae]MBI1494539.1 hypothetical protein [Paenihalocynthiibacter styelae]